MKELLRTIIMSHWGYDFTVDTKKRKIELVTARQIAMYVLKKNTGLSLSEIGYVVSKDHATVMYGVKRISDLIYTNAMINLVSIRSAVLCIENDFKNDFIPILNFDKLMFKEFKIIENIGLINAFHNCI